MAEITGVHQPGLFGKLPSKGDFVTRRLSRDFLAGWESWLGAGLSHSNNVLGETWQDIYLTSPIWRFAFASGICGRQAAVGVVLPSADRVGRCYPLAAVAMVDPSVTLAALAGSQAEWFEAMEAFLLDALEETANFDRLDEAIADLGVPNLGSGRRASLPLPWRGPLDGEMAIPEGAGCCFWGQGSERIGPTLAVAASLPAGELFTALLDGEWTDHGWHDAEFSL